MNSQRVLILDQQSSVRSSLSRILSKENYQVITVSSLQEARSLQSSCPFFHLAIIDLEIPESLEFIKNTKKQNPQTQIIALSNQENINLAVAASQSGISHFIAKPFNTEVFLSIIASCTSEESLKFSKEYQFNSIIGKHPELKKVLNLVERVSTSNSTTLITGESGTGKELIAKAIHYSSPRARKPFVPVNCGAIPNELLESELFGHIKGAFTGAIANRLGRFEMAHQGTIFLDEVGDMSPALQVKLLRFLQEQEFEPVGSTKTIQVNVHIITATNIDLEKAVAEGRFREDLYYRLNVIPIKTPALRERGADIPLLLHHFMKKFNQMKSSELTGFSDGALRVLFEYKWPGNIRELENLVERLAILKGSGEVQVSDLPEKYQKNITSTEKHLSIPDSGLDFNSAVDKYENALILSALEKTGWNRNQAAIILKLNRTTLIEKIKKKGLRPPHPQVKI